MCGKILKVDLRKNNKTKRYYIHKLVAEHFLENKYNYKIVNYKDDNKSNLEWVTYSQNNIHAYENNLKQKGKKYYNAKLTDEQVKKIITNGKGNNTYQEIADIYGVARATIRDILIKKHGNIYMHN